MKLRKRKLPSGAVTFFLDDFSNGERIRESLNVVIEPKSNPVTIKNQNRLAQMLFEKRQAEILLTRKGLLREDAKTLHGYAESQAVGRDQSDHVYKVLPYIKAHFGSMELRAVDYRACESFQVFLSRTNLSPKAKTSALSAKTVRHYFNALKFILNEAVRDRYLEVNPAGAVRPVKVPTKIPVSLTEDELKKLWNTPAGAPFAEIVKRAFFLSLNTGLRFGDIRSLTWGDIQTGDEGWRLIRAQNKTGGVVATPLNSDAVKLLKPSFSLDPEAYVFPDFQSGTNHAKYLPPWVRAAGITKNVTFHTARHTFGTNLASKGTNALLIQHLMGHTTAKMTGHYTQAAGREARGLVDSLPKLVVDAGV